MKHIKHINEDIDNHKDVDPYGEENWTENDGNEMDDFEIESIFDEPLTMFRVLANVDGRRILFGVYYDSDGQYSYHDIQRPEDVSEMTKNFLREHYQEISYKLTHYISENAY